MDHIPPVRNPSHNPPEVPYLCREGFYEIFTSVGFRAYPDLREINPEKLDYAYYSTTELNQFLQEWLYFGFFIEIMAIKKITVVRTDFIRRNKNGAKVIRSNFLPRYIHRWKTASMGKLSTEWETKTVARQLYLDAERAFSRLGESPSLNIDRNNISTLNTEEILHLSIALLLEAVRGLVVDTEWSSDSWGKLNMPYLNSILRAKNRCIYQTSGFLGRPSELFFLSLLPSLDARDHSQCSSRKCVGCDIGARPYNQKHTPDCQGCDPIGPNPDHLVNMYLERPEGFGPEYCTPVINVVDEGEGLRLEVVYSGLVSQWTAISHVWADGLGNPSGNTLPSCQVRNIANLCEKLQTQDRRNYYTELEGRTWFTWMYKVTLFVILSILTLRDHITTGLSILKSRLMSTSPSSSSGLVKTAFWLDTLCVPIANSVDINHSKEHESFLVHMLRKACRDRAISEMREIYRAADQVLVLDSDIQKIDGGGRHEKLYRIQLSNWMTRLWTLQEGISNTNTYFQTKNAAIWAGGFYLSAIEYLVETGLHGVPPTILKLSVASTLAWIIPRIRDIHGFPKAQGVLRLIKMFGLEEIPTAASLTGILPLLAVRSTSKADDEAICIATLMGISEAIPDLQQLPGPDRIPFLLRDRLGPYFDAQLLFTPGRRIDAHGLRWAPRSFLSGSSLSETQTAFLLTHWTSRYLGWLEVGFLGKVIDEMAKNIWGLDIGPQKLDIKTKSRPLAMLTKDGLQCQLPGWICTWVEAARVAKGWENYLHLESDDMTEDFCSKSKGFYAIYAWTSDDVLEELPEDYRRGTSAILWEQAVVPAWSDPETKYRGVLVALYREFDSSEEFVSVSYQCRVEVKRRPLVEPSDQYGIKLVEKDCIPRVKVVDVTWLVD
jgi:hypothetical protein